MKKTFFTAMLCCIVSYGYSQEMLLEKEIKLRSDFFSSKKRESFPIVNDAKNEIAMFLMDRKEITGYFFDRNYRLKDSLVTARPKSKYSTLLGSAHRNDDYNMVFANEAKNKFLVKKINPITKETSQQEFQIKSKKGFFLEVVSTNGRLFVLTIKRGTSRVHLFEFVQDDLIERKTIEMSDHKFSKTRKSLEYILTHTTSAIRDEIILSKIDNTNPNAIDITSYPNKIYVVDDMLYLTMDVYDDFSKVIAIDLKSYTHQIQDYPMKKVDCDHDLGVKSNSFLFGKTIFQVSGCENELYVSASNLEDGRKINEWTAQKDEPIEFKNTALIELKSKSDREKYKELDKTDQILKKIAKGNIGISAYNQDGQLTLVVGGYRKMKSDELAAAMLLASAVLGPVAITSVGPVNVYYYYNPTQYSFETYVASKSVYFKTLLNDDFAHIQGTVKDNAFDKIKNYLFENDVDNIKARTIFKVGEDYILSYYGKKEKIFYMIKFTH